LPMDYFYYPGLTTDEFLAYVKLSNASDDQLAKNFAKCCPSGTTRPNCPTSLTSNQYILCEN
jgi:hypothetical protein